MADKVKQPKTKRIMVINNDKEFISMVDEVLAEAGYATMGYLYNDRDIEEVKRIKPDLIVSDHLVTNEEQGWHFLQKLRFSRETAHIPIVVCTTNVKVVSELESRLESKAVRAVIKPFDIEELLEAVNQLLEQQTAGSAGGNAGFYLSHALDGKESSSV